jgi:hypothetical protein
MDKVINFFSYNKSSMTTPNMLLVVFYVQGVYYYLL